MFFIQLVIFTALTFILLSKIGQWYGIFHKVELLDKLDDSNMYYVLDLSKGDDLFNELHFDPEYVALDSGSLGAIYRDEKGEEYNHELFGTRRVLYGEKLLNKLNIHIIKGRGFSDFDENEVIVGYKWKNEVSIGQKIRVTDHDKPLKVVGVAREDTIISGESFEDFADEEKINQ